jgi:hypothetical protein
VEEEVVAEIVGPLGASIHELVQRINIGHVTQGT